MVRVLLTNFHPGDGGGHTTYLSLLMSAFENDPVVDLQLAVPGTSKAYGVAARNKWRPHAVEFPGKLHEIFSILRNLVTLRRVIMKEEVDVIHCNGSPDHRMVLYAVYLTMTKRRRPRVIFTKHNTFRVKPSLLNRIRYKCLTSHVISVCPQELDHFSALGLSETRLSWIPNGVDLEYFYPVAAERRAQFRDQLRIPAHRIVLVSCAGTAQHKGWHYLANALNDAPKVLRDSMLIVVLGKPPEQGTIQQVLERPGMPNLLFPGMQADVRPYLWSADAGFVLSTSVETISYACREMMSCGLPVLVSDAGCMRLNVDDSSGWVVRKGSKDAIADILEIISTSDLPAMGVAARRRAEQHFSLEIFKQATRAVYLKQLAPECSDAEGKKRWR